MLRRLVVPLTVIVLIILPGAIRAGESSEPGHWRCPATNPAPDVFCTDKLYLPPEEQPAAAEITTFSVVPWYLRPFDWFRDLFTGSDQQ